MISLDIRTVHVCVLQLTHAQSCSSLHNPMGCRPPGTLVHDISQARILEQVAISSSGDLPDPGTEPASLASPALAGGFFTTVPLRGHLTLKPSLYHSTLLKLRHTLGVQGPLLLII